MKQAISAYRKVMGIVMSMIAILLWSQTAMAAPTTVTGTVLDKEGLEVIGGVVEVKGTQTRVMTDINGQYSITVNNPSKAVLVFTYVG